MRGSTLVLAPLIAGVISCGGGNLPNPHRFWSMADLQLESHRSPCSNPGDLPCTYFVAPGASGRDVLQFKLAFAEGAPMGYMTTDFWANYDRIWLEPMYILVVRWNDQAPMTNRLPGSSPGVASGPIFSVGPQSAFYSPYRQVFYVEVPEGTAPDKYTTARQLFDDHLVMHPGPNRFASVGPADVDLPTSDDIINLNKRVADYLVGGANAVADLVLSSKKLHGWVDGVEVSYVDFGTDNFEVDAAQVIQDVPLFLFEKLDADGVPKLLGAPNVGGLVPLFSGRASVVSHAGRPQVGGLWRIHIVTVPDTARVLLEDDVMTPAGQIPPALANRILRVALDGSTCFANLHSGAPDTCTWLDSQASIEENIGPKGITRTGLQPACPFVMFNGIPVPYK